MTITAEALEQEQLGAVYPFPFEQFGVEVPNQERINRRTDDIAFNVKYLAQNIIDREVGLFPVEVEKDVMEQNVTDISEADVHKLGAVVYQKRDRESGQYFSLGMGTIDHAQKGIDALDMNDPANHFEGLRRIEERTNEVRILGDDRNEGLRRGGIDLFVSPSPTHNEADPDVAISHGYDDRTMLRFQTLSADGETKKMQSFSLFDAPAQAWAAYFGDKYGEKIGPTAIEVMQFCNRMALEHGSVNELLVELINGVKSYVDEDSAHSLDQQLDAFLNDQEEMDEQVRYYAKQKLDFQKELALSLGTWARPAVETQLKSVYEHLTDAKKLELKSRFKDGKLLVDDFVVETMLKISTVMADVRAGLATRNVRTFKRVASTMGLDMAVALADTEKQIQVAVARGLDTGFMVRRTEEMLAEAGVGCGGGCSVDVVDMFSKGAETAKRAGLNGTLYESKELDANSLCGCSKKSRKAKVIVDGSNVVCTTCGDFKVHGKRGNLKIAA